MKWDVYHWKPLPILDKIFKMSTQDLAQLEIFKNLCPQQINLLRPHFDCISYPDAFAIFEQGDPANFLYILVEGEVVVHYKPYDGTTITVTHIHPGGVFGWSSAMGRDVYTSGALSLSACQAYRIRGIDLRKLCEENPETGIVILEQLTEVIAERLRCTHDEILAILTQGIDNQRESTRRMKHERKPTQFQSG